MGFKTTGSGVGVGTGWVEAAALGCCEVDPAGLLGSAAQAARLVASKTATVLPYSLRIVLLGINNPHAWSLGLTASNTVAAPIEY